MKLHRFIGNFDFSARNFNIYDEEILNQVRNVLRLKAGDEMILSDGRLNEVLVKITRSDKKFIEVEILKLTKNENESVISGVLYCSILKRENFEWVCQKATEVGIREIVPLVSVRTVKLGFKEDRLKKIIKEAGEQSGRGKLPILSAPIKFEEALESAGQNDLNLFFEIGFSALSPLEADKMKPQNIGIFVGPEGGWSPEEVSAIKRKMQESRNFKIAGLGKLTLRAETAAVAACWLVCQSGN